MSSQERMWCQQLRSMLARMSMKLQSKLGESQKKRHIVSKRHEPPSGEGGKSEDKRYPGIIIHEINELQ
eukprot:1157908-Pelagomonas_calceolata.AAC.6